MAESPATPAGHPLHLPVHLRRALCPRPCPCRASLFCGRKAHPEFGDVIPCRVLSPKLAFGQMAKGSSARCLLRPGSSPTPAPRTCQEAVPRGLGVGTHLAVRCSSFPKRTKETSNMPFFGTKLSVGGSCLAGSSRAPLRSSPILEMDQVTKALMNVAQGSPLPPDSHFTLSQLPEPSGSSVPRCRHAKLLKVAFLHFKIDSGTPVFFWPQKNGPLPISPGLAQ